jgi:mRNA interferase RelE/StbE
LPFEVELTRRAARSLRKLGQEERKRIGRVPDDLATEPRPPASKRLRGTDDLWRVRTGAYRIVYRVEDDRLLVLVVLVGHRRDVYDQLRR